MTDSTFPDITKEAPDFIEQDSVRLFANIMQRQSLEISNIVFLASDYFRMTCRTDFKEGYMRAIKSLYDQTDSIRGISPWSIKLRQATPTLYYLELEAAIP